MAIVKMNKLVLAAPIDQRDEILDLLQEKQCVQLIDLKEKFQEVEGVGFFTEAKTLSQTEMDYNHIKFAYEFLKQYDTAKEGLFAKRDILSKEQFDNLESLIDWKDIYSQCKEIEEELNHNKNKKAKMVSLLEQYGQWSSLDVCDDELAKLKNVAYFIGTISKKYETQLYETLTEKFNDIYLEKIAEKQQDVNIIILSHVDNKNEIADILKTYGFVRISLELNKTPVKQMEELKQEIDALDNEAEEFKSRASGLAANTKDIEKIYDYILTKVERERAISNLVKTKKSFILEGWITEENKNKLAKAIESRFKDVYFSFEEPQEDDNPPIVLKNNVIAEPFEVVTSMYALPTPKEVDPTPLLTPFFLIFFGMMAADIGYGLVLFILTFFALKKMDLEGDLRKIVKLVMYCSIPTIFFGWMYGGFFGGVIPIKPLWVDPVQEPMQVLVASIALGLVHLYVGLGVKAYQIIKSGKILDAFFDVGSWYMLLSGAIWLFLGGGNTAKILAIAGAALILLTAGRENESIVGKFFGGVYGLYGVTGYIGDALSYARLLALGLASGLIGWSFNLLIGLFSGPVVYIAGPIIFLAGHTFNLAIGTLGTFVHTSRLQYLEFFGKFYEGGGKTFQPLKISNKFIKVNTEV